MAPYTPGSTVWVTGTSLLFTPSLVLGGWWNENILLVSVLFPELPVRDRVWHFWKQLYLLIIEGIPEPCVVQNNNSARTQKTKTTEIHNKENEEWSCNSVGKVLVLRA